MFNPVNQSKPSDSHQDHPPIESTATNLVSLFQEGHQIQRVTSNSSTPHEIKPLPPGDQPNNRSWIKSVPIIGNLASKNGIQSLKPVAEKAPEECFKISCLNKENLELPLSAKTRLAKESEYFNVLFHGQFKEGQTQEYRINVPKEDLELVLKWALGDAKCEDLGQMLNLFNVVDSLSLVSLKAKMEAQFTKRSGELVELFLESTPEDREGLLTIFEQFPDSLRNALTHQLIQAGFKDLTVLTQLRPTEPSGAMVDLFLEATPDDREGLLTIFEQFPDSLRNALTHQLIEEGFKDLEVLTQLRPTALKFKEIDAEFFHKLIHLCTQLKELAVPPSITDFSFIKDLPSTLAQLDLSECQALTDQYLADLSHLKNLISLNLHYCKNITNQGLIAVCQLKTLTTLDVSQCIKIRDEGFNDIQNLQDLKSLNIGKIHLLTEKTIEKLSALKNLVSINLDRFPSIAEATPIIKTWSQLQSLGLGNCELTSEIMQELYQLENLTSLDLTHTNLSGEAFRGIENLKRLTHLNLYQNKELDAEGFQFILRLEQLKELNLYWSGNMTNLAKAFKEIPKLKNLEFLNIAGCDWVDYHILTQLSQLKELILLDEDQTKKNIIRPNGVQIPKNTLDALARLPHLTTLMIGKDNYLAGKKTD